MEMQRVMIKPLYRTIGCAALIGALAALNPVFGQVTPKIPEAALTDAVPPRTSTARAKPPAGHASADRSRFSSMSAA